MIARQDELVTIFGGGGFVGRYVCEYLLKRGARIRVACRNPRAAHFLQPLGQVGQVGYVRADVTKPRSVEIAVRSSTAVVNLVGILKGKFYTVQTDGARHVAEAAATAGAKALVHISAIGADPDSESDYGRSKGRGELAVRAAFPQSTIIRPSLVFGPEDGITNRLAALSWLPLVPVIASKCRFQPVYVRDLAEAIVRAALDPAAHGGKTYEIAGPQAMTMRALHEAVLQASGQDTELVDMPDFLADLLSRFGFLPGAPLTRDQWRMLQHDNVPAAGATGLEAFGITPTPLAAVAEEWLGRFGGSRFARKRVNVTAG